MLTSTQKKVLTLLSCAAVLGIVFIFFLQRYGSLLRSQVFNAGSSTVSATLRTEQLPVGQYTLRFKGKSQSKTLEASTTFQISDSVTPYP